MIQQDIDTLIDLDFTRETQKSSTTYLTHNFHTYPAKFIPQIPKTAIAYFTKVGDTILDPFCGCGTSLVEAKLANRKGIGVDLNPIATLVSKVKATPIDSKILQTIYSIFTKIDIDINAYYAGDRIAIFYKLPNFHNRDHWFQQNMLHELAIIKAHIQNVGHQDLKDFLLCAFSAIIVKISNQESDTRFAAKNKNHLPKTAINEFKRKVLAMQKRLLEYNSFASNASTNIFNKNAQDLSFLADNSIDHIVTSPPYANTYDYYLYHKFRMYWLDYDVDKVRNEEIGSRNKHSSQKKDIYNFTDSLLQCMKECNRVLKPQKFAVVVIGDSILKGKLYKADVFMKEIADATQFEIVKIISSNLQKTTRMFNPRFTNSKKQEHIIVLKSTK